jgi:Zn-dependent peptidase ImmA (M78 family)
MIKNSKGSRKAKELLLEIGFEEITDIPMDIFVAGLGATLIEIPLKNSDGKIVRGNSKTLIKINSEIQFEERKRFTVAHEIGHFLLHSKLDLGAHNETSNTLNWFNTTVQQAKKGIQEWEANDFASELLMPEDLIRKETFRKKFSPDLVKDLSIRFKTSLTSIIYRLLSLDIYPLFVVFVNKGIVRYWSKSNNFWIKVKNITKLAPPEDSVALEYIDANYEYLYSGKEKAQQIYKSIWFELKDDEDDSDFFEYCIPTKQYETIISVIWEK